MHDERTIMEARTKKIKNDCQKKNIRKGQMKSKQAWSYEEEESIKGYELMDSYLWMGGMYL